MTDFYSSDEYTVSGGDGEYHYNKDEYTKRVYSDAHYVPVDDSTVPPRYYTPSYSGSSVQTKKQTPKRKKSGFSPWAVVCLCLIFSVIGGAVGAGLVYYKGSAEINELRSMVSASAVGASPSPNYVSTAVTASASAQTASPSAVYDLACRQTVGITTEVTYRNFFGQTSSSAVSGSGFVISQDGYVLTNYHVIETAYQYGYTVNVLFYDSQTYTAEIVGVEKDNDIAVLKINASGLTPVTAGDSDAIAVGDVAYAVGNPLGELEFTMTTGHISALDRLITTEDNAAAINMFQIDAAVNSGNSGGPVYDSQGRVIGIVTAKYSSSGVEGLGFAIPINDAKKIASDLITKGYVTGKAYLGVVFDETTVATYSRYYRELWGAPDGVLILSVESFSAADKAGICDYDIITSVGGEQVTSCTELLNILRSYSPGDTAEITLYRVGESSRSSQTLTVTVTFDEAGKASTDSSYTHA